MNQTIIFTVIPRGITTESETLPVSVCVTPRLFGATKLGSFPDWLNWTARIKDSGLHLTFLCEGNTLTLDVNRKPLRPQLWKALFNKDTLVRSYTFDDYSGRAVFSYPVRMALSALKHMYQVAGIALGLPDRRIEEDEGYFRVFTMLVQGESRDEQRGDEWENMLRDKRRFPPRVLLTSLLRGLEVNWNEQRGEAWRNLLRHPADEPSLKRLDFRTAFRLPVGSLGNDGLPTPEAMPSPGSKIAQNFHRDVVIPFAVFHHMPQPKSAALLKDEPPNFDDALDFHQALTALNNYPQLQRALGLVFDLDLPREFVAQTTASHPEAISVRDAQPCGGWCIPTTTPPHSTAYLHTNLDARRRLFFTAPHGVVDKAPIEALGLLNLDPARFGLAQVDVDGGMHKAIILAETLTGDQNLQPVAAPHPEVFDPTSTLPSLRSGGFSLFADARALQLLQRFEESKKFNEALAHEQPQPRPFYAEDLVRGYRLDIWDSHTKAWHSLHRRNGIYTFGEGTSELLFETEDEEGFVQLTATQAAKGADGTPPPNDLYLHEAIARWAGWSLSAPMPGKHLTRSGDPAKAVPQDDPSDPDFDPENPPVTPFKLAPIFKAFPGSLPSLRLGRSYRLRARVVDLAGNSLGLDDELTKALSIIMGLPRDPEGFAYLRYEPVIAPLLVMRDERALTGPGSGIDRVVIRTFNSDPSLDNAPADLTASDRHIVPPRTSVEMGERLGMFDDADGTLISTPTLYNSIKQRDEGELKKPPQPILVGGQAQDFPLEPGERIHALPYLPDALSRGAALRDLPGTPAGARAKVAPGAGAVADVPYVPLNDPNPRPGSVTLISFGGETDWQEMKPFRFALADSIGAPTWDPVDRVLTVHLPKGTTHIVPLSSYLNAEDLKLMGIWQWLREYIEYITAKAPQQQSFFPDGDIDRIAHILQRAVEGGHWMLTPPRLLTLVHAVQQPLGVPEFTRLTVQRKQDQDKDPHLMLHTEPEGEPTGITELATISAWRRLDSVEAYLLGALRVHGASTAKVDIYASWEDPIDDPSSNALASVQQTAHADEIPLERQTKGYLLRASGKESRAVGYYIPTHDMIAFVRSGDALGSLPEGTNIYPDAAPRHHFNDTKHHRVRYTAVATSRYREYFPQNKQLDFTRTGEAVTVHVPASARPAAPRVVYVIPTFGWQRQTETNMKRSVRFGGGLRIYLERPWYSSGAGELLGVTLWNYWSDTPDDQARDQWKPFVTQWGADPIWQTASMDALPSVKHFPDAVASERSLSLEERTPNTPDGKPGRVDVVGFPVHFDEDRKLWYCDLLINTFSPSYMPFVRLALVRYQPHALPDAKLSRVVLADFVQLTPDRSAVVTADPYHPRRLRLTISGPAPRGPEPVVGTPPPTDTERVHVPTRIVVAIQQRNPAIISDLAWEDVPPGLASITLNADGPAPGQPDLYLWSGTVEFEQHPANDQYRLLIREYEYVSANYTTASAEIDRAQPARVQPGRLIYAEAIEIDAALISQPPQPVIGVCDGDDLELLP